MKTLALLLALPLAACATSQHAAQLRPKQAAEARRFCTANNERPSDPRYPRCINRYLQTHYGWQVVQEPDGSLRAAFLRRGPLYF